MKAAAERAGMGQEMLRKARAFARQYTDEQRKDPFALCKECDYALGVSHVLRLLAVKPACRAAFLKKAAEGRWSVGRIDDEIRRRYTARFLQHRGRGVGRRPRVPTKVKDALADLGRVCFDWGRLLPLLGPPESLARRAAAARADREGHPPPWERLPDTVKEQVQRAAVWGKLPPGVRQQVEEAWPVLEGLGRAVTDALAPERKAEAAPGGRRGKGGRKRPGRR